jgi:PHD/YefM family antitoxin component YafN of YafNO toxin-antitoxin module
MNILSYTEMKTNLRQRLDECERTNIPICIVSRKNQMIVISKAEYEMMIDKINGINNDTTSNST